MWAWIAAHPLIVFLLFSAAVCFGTALFLWLYERKP